jgi:hypothetical protein
VRVGAVTSLAEANARNSIIGAAFITQVDTNATEWSSRCPLGPETRLVQSSRDFILGDCCGNLAHERTARLKEAFV